MITICFTRPKKWSLLSWLIMRFTRSKISHAAIGIDIYGVPALLHATISGYANGVQITTRERFEKDNRIVEEYEPLWAVDAGMAHAVRHVGDRYDVGALFGFAWLITMWRWFGKKVKNPLASPTALVCSEFVLHLDHLFVVPEWRGLDPETTDAEQLRHACARSPMFRRRP